MKSFAFGFFLVGLFFFGIRDASAAACDYNYDGRTDAGYRVVSGVCIPTNTGLSSASPAAIVVNVMNWLLGILGLVAMLLFVYSGWLYLSAAGDEKKTEEAKNNIKFVIIGIAVALSAFIIVRLVANLVGVSGGGLGASSDVGAVSAGSTGSGGVVAGGSGGVVAGGGAASALVPCSAGGRTGVCGDFCGSGRESLSLSACSPALYCCVPQVAQPGAGFDIFGTGDGQGVSSLPATGGDANPSQGFDFGQGASGTTTPVVGSGGTTTSGTGSGSSSTGGSAVTINGNSCNVAIPNGNGAASGTCRESCLGNELRYTDASGACYDDGSEKDYPCCVDESDQALVNPLQYDPGCSGDDCY